VPIERKRGKCLNAFDLHRIIISTLHENWRPYIRKLENDFIGQVRSKHMGFLSDLIDEIVAPGFAR
jgi:hypothetical protein